MGSERRDPRIVRSVVRSDGLEIARQAAPASSASFAASLLVPAGWAYESSRTDGLAEVYAKVATSAAGQRDRVALSRFLDEHAATLSREVDPEMMEFAIRGPQASFRPLMQLLAEVVLAPRLEAEDLERVRRQTVEGLLRESTQPGSRADRELLSASFPKGHPYARTGTGSRRSVLGLRREDLRRFLAQRFSAEGSLLVVTTSLPLSEVQSTARRCWPEFPAGHASRAQVPAVPRRRLSTRTVRLPGRSQVEIRLGGPSIARSDPTYPAAYLAGEVLGGGLLSRLFQRLRETDGLAYHASAGLEAMRWGGYWMVQAGTGPERLPAARRALRAELARLRSTDGPRAELERIRESVIGQIPLAFETSSGAHQIAVDIAYHHLGEESLLEWPTLLRSVSRREVRRAAAEAFGAEGSVEVLAGPVPGRSRRGSRDGTRTNTHK